MYQPTIQHRIMLPLEVAARLYAHPRYREWASKWRSGDDRTAETVRVVLAHVRRDEHAPQYVAAVLLAALKLAEAFEHAATATALICDAQFAPAANVVNSSERSGDNGTLNA
jgi:hypothetical protein